MPIALPSITIAPYISKLEKDKPEPEQTTWMLKPLNGLQHLEVTSTGYTNWPSVVVQGLKGWSNFKDENGVEMPFTYDNIARVPALYLQDIGREILKRSSFDEEKSKNSSSQ